MKQENVDKTQVDPGTVKLMKNLSKVCLELNCDWVGLGSSQGSAGTEHGARILKVCLHHNVPAVLDILTILPPCLITGRNVLHMFKLPL